MKKHQPEAHIEGTELTMPALPQATAAAANAVPSGARKSAIQARLPAAGKWHGFTGQLGAGPVQMLESDQGFFGSRPGETDR